MLRFHITFIYSRSRVSSACNLYGRDGLVLDLMIFYLSSLSYVLYLLETTEKNKLSFKGDMLFSAAVIPLTFQGSCCIT